MASKSPTKEPPAWFNKDDYREKQLDARFWAIMLWARQAYLDQFESIRTGGHRADLFLLTNAKGRQAFWDAYLEDVRPARFIKDPSLPLPSGLSPPIVPPVEDVTAPLVSSYRQSVQDKITAMTDFNGLRLLAVDPAASDKHLKKEFGSWLQGIRKTRPLPFVRRGPKSGDQGISDSHFETWHAHRVLAVIDLDFHARLFARRRLSRPVLCDEVNPGFLKDPTDWGKSARNSAEAALRAVDPLIAQIQSGVK